MRAFKLLLALVMVGAFGGCILRVDDDYDDDHDHDHDDEYELEIDAEGGPPGLD